MRLLTISTNTRCRYNEKEAKTFCLSFSTNGKNVEEIIFIFFSSVYSIFDTFHKDTYFVVRKLKLESFRRKTCYFMVDDERVEWTKWVFMAATCESNLELKSKNRWDERTTSQQKLRKPLKINRTRKRVRRGKVSRNQKWQIYYYFWFSSHIRILFTHTRERRYSVEGSLKLENWEHKNKTYKVENI